MREIAAEVTKVPLTGAYGQAWRLHAEAAAAAVDGRTAEASAGFRDSHARILALEQYFEAANWVVDAAILLPAEPEVRAWAVDTRPLLEELRAKPYLERLDEALASVPGSGSTVHAASAAETRSSTTV